ncbi:MULTISPECIES: hypothetical protein [unclassified Pseudomonas]|uniref:hypothetical protein n=1 Tax=unclassified Pseudomonas TaxID=196821 RepID=UPI002AC9B911|nr:MULTISPECIES: hypothetical protein [unclassified Pseudomonas]MEB0044496.1 hypothetical protein [Pseudomonas sp. Dout3]MEB0095694.1 hypothetical protein [Pseudomonas sp. DC1.2]WPX58255.1 hypothetical protein RHM68_22105 [Pseudomonas sp. DC1.2]
MTLYQDELAFWDDVAARYMFKFAVSDENAHKVVTGAADFADLMVVERRKRKRAKAKVPVAINSVSAIK